MDIFTESYIRETYSSKTKWTIITDIIHTYCASHLNRNLWMIKLVVKILQNIELLAHKPQETITAICKLISYINRNKAYEFTPPNDSIQHMLYSSYSSCEMISFMYDLVNEDTYTLLSILYKNIKDSLDLIPCLAITRHILSNSQSIKSKDLDTYDCMFIFILKLIDQLHLPLNIAEYITASKDLFYYRLKKKNRADRCNLIYFSIYVMVTRRVSNKALSESSHDYLFITPKINLKMTQEMDLLRKTYKKSNNYKSVTITTNEYITSNFEIIKK